MWERLTKHALIAMEDACTEAKHLGHPQIEPEHLLLALLRDSNQASNPKWGSHLSEHVATRVLRDLNTPLDQLRALTLQALPPGESGPGAQETMSPACEELMGHASEEAQSLSSAYIGTEHLLMALLRPDTGSSARVLDDVGVTPDLARTRIRILCQG